VRQHEAQADQQADPLLESRTHVTGTTPQRNKT
jgi:hypothetical protein